MRDFIQLESGTSFYFLSDPRELRYDVSLEEIAIGLSRMPRYGGQTRRGRTYRVAEHCVKMARYARKCGYPLEVQMTALMHDAPEGLGMMDLVRPVKQHLGNYKEIENNIYSAVALRFYCIDPIPAIVKEWDFRILADERPQVMRKTDETWVTDGVIPLGIKVDCWSERKCFREFVREGRSLLERILNQLTLEETSVEKPFPTKSARQLWRRGGTSIFGSRVRG